LAATGLARGAFLEKSGAAGAAVLRGSLLAMRRAAARASRRREAPIRNFVISCQPNMVVRAANLIITARR
jgi:hypothetical protein